MWNNASCSLLHSHIKPLTDDFISIVILQGYLRILRNNGLPETVLRRSVVRRTTVRICRCFVRRFFWKPLQWMHRRNRLHWILFTSSTCLVWYERFTLQRFPTLPSCRTQDTRGLAIHVTAPRRHTVACILYYVPDIVGVVISVMLELAERVARVEMNVENVNLVSDNVQGRTNREIQS